MRKKVLKKFQSYDWLFATGYGRISEDRIIGYISGVHNKGGFILGRL